MDKKDLKFKNVYMIGELSNGSYHQILIDKGIQDILINVLIKYYDGVIPMHDKTIGGSDYKEVIDTYKEQYGKKE